MQQSGHPVHDLDNGFPVLPGDPISGVPDEQGGVGNLVVVGHLIFAPIVVLCQQEAVVRAYDEHGVLPHAVFVHQVQDAAQRVVAHGH